MYDFSFLKGNIETIILNALYSGPKYGYEIAKEIKEKTENKYEIKQPTLYGYLKRLQENDLITPYWDGGDSNGGRRRYYQLTAKGKEICIQYMSEWTFQRNVIDNLVAQPTDNDEIKEISQEQATSLLGSKTKKMLKKRSYLSDNELDELNKQLEQLNVSDTNQADNTSSINEDLKNTAPAKPQFIFAPTNTTPYIEKIDTGVIKTEQNRDNEIDNNADTELKENTEISNPTTSNTYSAINNTAPAKPQFIFAPTNQSTIDKASSYPKEKLDNSVDTMSAKSDEDKTEDVKSFDTTTDDTPYRQILGDVIGGHLKEMSDAKFDSPEKFQSSTSENNGGFVNKHVVKSAQLSTEVEKLNNKGITTLIFDPTCAEAYKSPSMYFSNKVKFIVALLITLSIAIETIAMYFIFRANIDELKFGFYAIVVVLSIVPTIYYAINYFSNPTKKKRKAFNFKFNFVNAWIFVGSVFIILTIIYFVIIGVGSLQKFLECYLFPFIISLNAPLGVCYKKLLLEKKIFD